MIVSLIVLTIIFEKGKHELEHGRTDSQKLVINALFGEVTVLGFIALITFFLIKFGLFSYLSQTIYDSPDHALHLFEDVHFGLFFTMMVYLFLVIWMLVVQRLVKDKWYDLEDKTRKFMRSHGMGKGKVVKPSSSAPGVKPPSLPMPRDEYLEWRYNGGGRIPVGFEGVLLKEDASALEEGEYLNLASEKHDDPELHAYMLLRARFVWGFKNGEGRKNSSVDLTFDFARYLDNCMGQTLTEIVVVHEFTWVVVAVSMLLAYAFFGVAGSSAGYVLVVVLFGFLLVAAMVIVLFSTRDIYHKLSPPPECTVKQVLTGAPVSRPPYEAMEMEKGVNKHERLFPFHMGSKGPDFFEHYIRTTVLLAAIYLVGVVVVFLPIFHKEHLEAMIPVCMACVATTCFLVKPVLGRLTVITSVGMLKRLDVVDATMRQVRLERSIKTMKILASVQSQMRKINKLREREEGSAKGPRKDIKISEAQRRDLQDAFDLFDEDKSGSITSDELYNLLRSLGQAVTPAEAERLLLEMDTGNDGTVDFEEFIAVMAEDDSAEVTDPETLAEDIFKMLDKDGSGYIINKELREFLRQLPIDLTEEQVDTMLIDIFGSDDDASIDVDEFKDFLASNAGGH